MSEPVPIRKQDSEAINALCRQKFDAFAQRAFRIVEPGTAYEWSWHIGCVAEHLEAVYNGEISRLIINEPPRTLKTYEVSVSFPAWCLGKDPTYKFITTSFKYERAVEMAQKCRHIVKDEWYKECFPQTIIDSTQDQKHNFHTTMRGKYYSSAISSVTGSGADVVIADDIVSPDEALSETIRNSTNNTVRNTLFSRFNDPRKGKFILVMQRLHEDDPTGNLLRDEGWVHLKLPAIAQKKIIIQLGKQTWKMEEGELLHPTRLTKAVLDDLRLKMSDYHFIGQYLQEPQTLGGGEFKDTWMQYYGVGGIKPKEMNIVILVDPSGGEELNRKKKKSSDWTAMMVVGLAPDNNYYLLDIIRDRLNPTERIDTLFILHRKWNELGGKPPKCGYERISMQSDVHYIKKKMEEDSYRFNIIELGGTQIKEERIRKLIPDMQMGRWFLPATLMYCDNEGRTFDLVKELVYSECPAFPRARFDDMLDALSRVYENDLMLSFPKPKISAISKSMQPQQQPESWLSY